MQRREIKAKEIVKDIYSGMTDPDLMDKYRLTFSGLQDVFDKLLTAKAVDSSILHGRIKPKHNGAAKHLVSRAPRKEIFLPLPVHDMYKPESPGIVVDVTERGLGIRGIYTAVGATKTLMVRADEIFQLDSFSLRAKCRWIRKDENDETVSGFEIVHISPKNAERLKSLILTCNYLFR